MPVATDADNQPEPDGPEPDGDIRFSYASAEFPLARRLLIQAIERLSGQRRLKRLYDANMDAVGRGEACFFDTAVAALGLDVRYDPAALERVPRDGPVVFVANHPYGVLDGITLTWLARKVRPDTKVLAHSVLCQVHAARRHLLPIDFSGTPEARQVTLASRIAAQKWLRQGHAVGIFPAGGVATSQQPLGGPAFDPPWHPFTAKLVRRARATVVPVYFAGQNSRAFQLASHVSYTLRLSLLFRETARRMGSRLDVGIGQPVDYAELAEHTDRHRLVADVRRRTFGLAHRLYGSNGQVPDYGRELRVPRHLRFG